MLWLECASTNHDPGIVVNTFTVPLIKYAVLQQFTTKVFDSTAYQYFAKPSNVKTEQ